MYLNPNEFPGAFRKIKKTSLTHSTCKLVIYASCLLIDSLCGAKVLSLLLKKELIPYQLIPVVGYSDLKGHYGKLDADITNVILIGCGAIVDIEGFLNIDAAQYVEDGVVKRRIYVMDGHRPWNLDNVFGSDIVTCFDDGHIEEDLGDEKVAYEKLLEVEGEEEEEEEEEENTDDDEEGEEANESNQQNSKRLKEAAIAEHEDTLETYYGQGTTISTSIAAQMYSMVSSLSNEASVDSLWLTIIGATSLDYLYPQVYKKFYPLLKDEVMRIADGNELAKKADNTSIVIGKDYYLFLLRHWSLYNSFYYSNFVNSKLLLWQEEGRKKLNKMFAKMGISLQVANQNWLYMDIEVKRKLNSIFAKYLEIYDLQDLMREGFVRQFGYNGSISAREYVEALVALLQHNESQPEVLDGPEDNLLDENPEREIMKKLVDKESFWVGNFWSSWDALTNQAGKKNRGIDMINRGLEIARDYQQIIFRTGVMVMEKKMIKNLRVFRLVVLKDESIPNLAFYRNPLNLTRLGQWILESLAEIEYLALLPLVLAMLDLDTDTYLLIGLAPLYSRSMLSSSNEESRLNHRHKRKHRKLELEPEVSASKVLLNTFSVAFRQVANSTGAKVRIDSFESSVIEVRKEDLSPFLEKLTLCGLV